MLLAYMAENLAPPALSRPRPRSQVRRPCLARRPSDARPAKRAKNSVVVQAVKKVIGDERTTELRELVARWKGGAHLVEDASRDLRDVLLGEIMLGNTLVEALKTASEDVQRDIKDVRATLVFGEMFHTITSITASIESFQCFLTILEHECETRVSDLGGNMAVLQ